MRKLVLLLAAWLVIVPAASADEAMPAWMSDAVQAGQAHQRMLDAEHEERDRADQRYRDQRDKEERELAADMARDKLLLERLRRETAQNQAEALRMEKELARRPPARLGMTPEQVARKTRWGWPSAGSRRTVNAHGTTEFWHYSNGGMLMFTNGKLTSMSY